MRHFPRRRPAISALVPLTLAIACAAGVIHNGRIASAAAASTMQPAVTITGYSFHPALLTVKNGSTVIWVNNDGDVHTIKSTAGPEAFSSPALDSGGRFKYTFHRAGTYHYACSVHPYMRGVIVVR